MPTDLRDKLRRLGVHKGASKIQHSPPSRRNRAEHGPGLESLVDGREIDTPHGPSFIHEDAFPIGHIHGSHRLSEVMDVSPSVAAQMVNDPELAQIDLSRAAFIDTETTGLSGGTGTLAFLIGVGAFDLSESAFVVRQYFLRSPAEEPAMLYALAGHLDDFDTVVSFNGRGFDMPLLEARFTLARMRPRILRAPHLDLLMPARRVWRSRLESCALSSLEHHVLNVRREQADVPGFLIPEMYVHYVRTGDAGEMPRVLYHNRLDILSMVSLSTRLVTLFSASPHSEAAEKTMDAGDWLALGKWHADHQRASDAESALRSCLAAGPGPVLRAAALHQLGHLLKEHHRRTEALRVWEALSDSPGGLGLEACVELAKHYEWQDINLERAAVWTREAINLVASLPEGHLRDERAAELSHRWARLSRKRERL